MDAILESFINDFADHYDYKINDRGKLFEIFVNHTIISRLTQDEVDIDKTNPGDSGDLGLDGIIILISGHPVFSIEDIDFFLDRGNADVDFVFIQSKTKRSFCSNEIGTFLDGIRRYFEDTLPDDANDKIRDIWNLKKHIFENSIKLDKAPSCRCYYAAPGEWKDDPVCQRRVRTGIDDLTATSLFKETPEFHPLDREKLKSIYRALRHKITCEIHFDKNTVIPPMEGVSEAYLGILPCKQFLKLIIDEDGELRPNLFYNNVRDYQGDTPVNKEIMEVLKDSQISKEFALLNNGITIVARSINRIGDKFKISDFQIVNGCQTSNVLYSCRDSILDSTYLPLKLIVTNDPEVTNRITRATNRQTEVKPEAFESLGSFHRTLEDFYNAMSRHDEHPRLYYERRSKQYIHERIKQHQVITLAGQTTSFLAMFLDEPHSTHRYYGEILRSMRGRIFDPKHKPFPYYISALTLTQIERLFNEGKIDKKYRSYKHHMLLLFRHVIVGKKLPPLSSPEIDKICDKIMDIYTDADKVMLCANTACKTIDAHLHDFGTAYRQGNPPSRLRDFTFRIMGTMNKRLSGSVKYYDTTRGFGFISHTGHDDVFVHYSAIRENTNRYLQLGDYVEFDVIDTSKGMQAENVIITRRADA